MAAWTKLNEGTESADNKVAKLEGAQGHEEGTHQHDMVRNDRMRQTFHL